MSGRFILRPGPVRKGNFLGAARKLTLSDFVPPFQGHRPFSPTTNLLDATRGSDVFCPAVSTSANPSPEHKSVTLLIWATMGLVAMNLVMVLLVFLPPKRTTLRGVVVFRGTPPEVPQYTLADLDPACAAVLGDRVRSPEWTLSTNRSRPELAAALGAASLAMPRAGLAGAIVRIQSPAQSLPVQTAASTTSVLEVLPCQTTPRWLVVWTNQPVQLHSSVGATQWMVLSGGESHAPKTIQLPPGVRSEVFSVAEEGQFFRLSPQERPWLRTDILALAPQPFAVSDADGVFEFRGRIPSEGATLEIFHPQAGRKSFRLTKDVLRAPLVLEIGTE